MPTVPLNYEEWIETFRELENQLFIFEKNALYGGLLKGRQNKLRDELIPETRENLIEIIKILKESNV